jgi:hypothetical protein
LNDARIEAASLISYSARAAASFDTPVFRIILMHRPTFSTRTQSWFRAHDAFAFGTPTIELWPQGGA